MARRTCLLLALMAVAVVMAVPMAGSASAWRNEYSGKLPGKTWTAGNGVVLTNQVFQFVEVYGGPTAVCIGPVQNSGGKWVFPYGWDCGHGALGWEYSPITAAAGTDNPNSGEITSYTSVAN